MALDKVDAVIVGAGAAGSVFAAKLQAITPGAFEFNVSIMLLCMVILGGMGSIPGAALGGLILGLTESFVGTFYGAAASAFLSFGVVIVLLIVRPWGILGTSEA